MSDDPSDRLLEARISHRLRSAAMAVFVGTGDQGALMLMAIGDRCGIHKTEAHQAAEVSPELVTFWNWLLSLLGIRGDPDINLTNPIAFQNYIQEAKALQAIANMSDVDAELSALSTEGTHAT